MLKIMTFLIAFFLPLREVLADDIQKYEQYLNSFKTLSAKVTQTNRHHQTTTGTLQISRPGKMRLQYNPPSSLLIVADGTWLITKDTQTGDVDYASWEKTLAAFILRYPIRLRGDVEVTNIIPKDKTTEISFIRKEDPEAGYITLIFEDTPLSLKGWRIVDAQGAETEVILSELQSNIPLPPQLFQIEQPNLLQQIF